MSGELRRLPISRERLLELASREAVFNVAAFLDTETGEAFDLPEDVLAYCRGEREGTDLQLSDSRDLGRAQAVAEEQVALASGYDAEGLPFDEEDRRFVPLVCLGDVPGDERDAAVDAWLGEHGLETD